jgi:hypothetical protein
MRPELIMKSFLGEKEKPLGMISDEEKAREEAHKKDEEEAATIAVETMTTTSTFESEVATKKKGKKNCRGRG